MEKTKRILFVSEAVTLAHIARCIILADKLHKTGQYTLCLAADSRYDHIIGNIPYQRLPLNSVSSHYFFKKLANGAPLYDVKTLSAYVEEDVKIMDDYQPDFVFGDFRLSLAISCRLKKIPYASISNAYWSPYADINYPVPEIPLTKWLGVSIAQKLFDWFRPLVFAVHTQAFNKTCKKFGLPPLSYDMRKVYTEADYTLYADCKGLVPMQAYPDTHIFIGPVLWSADVALPHWWAKLPEHKAIVFITLGSSGDGTILPLLIDALASMDITIIAVTAKNSQIEQAYKNVFVSEFLPVEQVVKKSDIVICNGGSPMVYQALADKKKLIGIPGNLDQYLMMSIIKSAGLGDYIRSGLLTDKAIRSMVNKLLKQKNIPDVSYDFNDSATIIEQLHYIIQSATTKTSID